MLNLTIESSGGKNASRFYRIGGKTAIEIITAAINELGDTNYDFNVTLNIERIASKPV